MRFFASRFSQGTGLAAALLLSFALLVSSAIRGTYMAYPLLLSLGLFVAVLNQRGFRLRELAQMGLKGCRQALPVVNILLLIGSVIAIWMAAGTVPALVYYGTQLIQPRLFVLSAFVLTGAVSVLIGTSFGAAGTIGLALMVMARGSSINPNLVAGAIIAGAYVGDRCSPMSSSACLVASITRTSLHRNLKNMVVTSAWPMGLTLVVYLVLSLLNPAQLSDNPVIATLPQYFQLSPLALLPAIAMLLLAMLRLEVKLAMLVSLGIGIAIAHGLQGYSLTQLVKFTLTGFTLDAATPLSDILLGGGLLAMGKAVIVVLISTAFAGIFAGTKAFASLEKGLGKIQRPDHLFAATTGVGTAAAIFGCTQTIAILLTQQIMQPHYQTRGSQDAIALDLENTVVVISPLIPWNIAGLIPATVLTVGPGFIPYAIYLYLTPLFIGLGYRFQQDQSKFF